MRTARTSSAGGLVLAEPSPTASVALIAHASPGGKVNWTLPKGQPEPGETVEATALREVREETGLRARILSPLDTIDYWFVWAGDPSWPPASDGQLPGPHPDQLPGNQAPTRYHKFVHYFLMLSLGGDLADHDHEVVDARWFAPDEAAAALAYANERRLLARVPGLLETAR